VNPSGANNEQTGATVDQARTYLYDASERLVEVKTSNNQTVATYRYDPFGRRVRKTVSIPNTTITPQNPIAQSAGTTFFGFASEGMIAEFKENGDFKVSYAYTPALASGSHATWQTNPIYKREPSPSGGGQGGGSGGTDNLHAFHTDHLGTPQALTAITATQSSSTPPTANPSVIGKVTWRANFESFGAAAIDQTIVNAANFASGIAAENNHRFPGQFFDAETGLAQNLMRDYESVVGKYVQLDPKLEDSAEPYSYVASQPTLDVDPTGEIVPIILGAYSRCVAQCMAMSCLTDVFSSPDSCKTPCFDNLGPCLQGCLNPLNWGVKGKGPYNKRRPPPPPPGDCKEDDHRRLEDDSHSICNQPQKTCSSIELCIAKRMFIMRKCFRGGDKKHHLHVAQTWREWSRCGCPHGNSC
jgi:RHS repeat-associated protein